ncbi:MAG: hypothetical protein ABJM39_11845 [Porticoccus sp.]
MYLYLVLHLDGLHRPLAGLNDATLDFFQDARNARSDIVDQHYHPHFFG